MGDGCTRVQRFSGPNVRYQGMVAGSNSQNNARQLNDGRQIVANYFQSKSSGPTPAPTTAGPMLAPTTAGPTPAPPEAVWRYYAFVPVALRSGIANSVQLSEVESQIDGSTVDLQRQSPQIR